MFIRLFLVSICFVVLARGENEPLSIAFSDLRQFAEKSPYYERIKAKVDYFIAKNKAELQLSNPEFTAEQEKVKDQYNNETESNYTVSKHFISPWIRSHRKKGVSYLIKAERIQSDINFEKFLADIKSNYIAMQLYRQKMETVLFYENIVKKASQTIMELRRQGTVSGIEQQIIDLSLVNVQSLFLKMAREKDEYEKNLLFKLNIAPMKNIKLDSIYFIPLDESDLDRLSNNIISAPSIRRLNLYADAISEEITEEKLSVFSDFSLSAGYKQINDNLKGYTVGVSFPLPMLNQNGAQIQMKKAQQRASNAEIELMNQKLETKVLIHVSNIKNCQQFLQTNKNIFTQAETIFENLLFTYQQGWSTLTEMLNSLDIYREAMESYSEQLYFYYTTLFQLELLLDVTLVNF